MNIKVGARLNNVNILARDVPRLCTFYAQLLGFQEILSRRTDIYRVLDAGGVELGFNALRAYELLELAARMPQGFAPVTTYATFEVEDTVAVDHLALEAVALGGQIVKAPYVTHYLSRQAVLQDLEGNVFRINAKGSVV